MSSYKVFASGILLVGLAIAQDIHPSQDTRTAATSTPPDETNSATNVAIGEPFEWAAPKYPKRALKTGFQGTVVLAVTVDTEGAVRGASILGGDPELAEAAIKAVRKWKYVPYDIEDQPAVVTTQVTIEYKITSGGPDVSVICNVPPKPDIGSVYDTLKGLTPPKPLYSPAPRYSQQAKNDKYQGVCVLGLVVGPDGKTYDIKVIRTLGDDLDQMAIEAVRKWKFEPARKDGQPVAALINVEVSFHLY